MCGEKTGGYIDAVSGAGSPPHVRGKGFLDFSHEVLEVNYAPVYNFNGAAPTKDDLVEAERMSQAEFNEMMEQWQRDNDRKRF